MIWWDDEAARETDGHVRRSRPELAQCVICCCLSYVVVL